MKAVFYSESMHYEMLCSWWDAYKWIPVAAYYLPTRGVVVENNGKQICAGFCYSTDSALSWIGFIVSNPKAFIKEKAKGLDLLVKKLLQVAKDDGATCVFTVIGQRGLKNLYKKNGFLVTEDGMSNLIKPL